MASRSLRHPLPFSIQHDWHLALLATRSTSITKQRLLPTQFWLSVLFADGTETEYIAEYNRETASFHVEPSLDASATAAAASETKPTHEEMHARISIEYLRGVSDDGTSPSIRIRLGDTSYVVLAPGVQRRACSDAAIPTSNRSPLPRTSAVALTSDASHVVFGNADGYSAVQSLPYGGDVSVPAPVSTVELQGHLADINVATWFPSNKVVLTASVDMSLRVFDAASGRCAAILKGHTSGITAAVPISKGKTVASCDRKGHIKLWNLATAECIADMEVGAGANAMTVVQCPALSKGKGCIPQAVDVEDKMLLVACEDGSVWACAPDTQEVRQVLSFTPTGAPSYASGAKALCLHQYNNEILLVGGSDGQCIIAHIEKDGGISSLWQGSVDASDAEIKSCCVLGGDVHGELQFCIGTSSGDCVSLSLRIADGALQAKNYYSGSDLACIRGMSVSKTALDDGAMAVLATASNDGFVRVYFLPA